MIARIGASLAILAAISMGCGKYGPPVRIQSGADSGDPTASVAPADGDDRSDEDSDPKERRP
jgi:hypothetical protein